MPVWATVQSFPLFFLLLQIGSLCWKVSEEDENLIWFFEKADGSFKHNGDVLFYYGSDFDADALASFSKTSSTIHTQR